MAGPIVVVVLSLAIKVTPVYVPGIKDCSCLDQGFKVISSEDLDLNWS
jgi:hypothetical protein